MSESKIYYKAFDPNLCDEDRFQYTVGEEIVVENIYDPNYKGAWTVCYSNIALCLSQSESKVMKYANPALTARICEVQPTGNTYIGSKIYFEKPCSYCLTNRLKVIRELSSEEIINLLWDTDAYFLEFIRMHAPFEDLYKLKDNFQILDNAGTLFDLSYLSKAQIKELIPEAYYHYLDRYVPGSHAIGL